MHPRNPDFSVSRPFAVRMAWGALLCLGLSQGQETLSSVQRELDRVERETEREKELHKTDRLRAVEFEKRKSEKTQALKEQIRLSDERMDSLRRQADTERRKRAGNKGQVAMYQSKQKEFRISITKEIEILAAWMDKDFPFQKEKMESFNPSAWKLNNSLMS